MTRSFHLAVLGSPVAHSLSPVMHRAGLAAVGLIGSYEAIEVDERGMETQAHRLRRGELDGANITMPHKRLAARLADRLMASAERAGAVNTWWMDDHELVGESTDVAGVRIVLERRALPAETVLILGSGGAAAAALVATEDRRVLVSGRSEQKVRALLRDTGITAESIEWGSGVDGATVINATPIGMHGEELPPDVVDRAAGVFDMTYGSGPSPALRAAQAADKRTADGIDLLAAQAEESFEIWTGVGAPSGLFESVARNVSRPPRTPPIQGMSE